MYKALIHLQVVFLFDHDVFNSLPPDCNDDPWCSNQIVLFVKATLFFIKKIDYIINFIKSNLESPFIQIKILFLFHNLGVHIKISLKILHCCLLWLVASMFFCEICLKFSFACYLFKFWHHISIFPHILR